jgi:hypothetical protein
MKYMEGGDEKSLTVNAGETCFVAKGERFRPVFPQGEVEYIPVCIPAFKPERCHREEDAETSQVTARLRELHTNGTKANDSLTTGHGITDNVHNDIIYHMCEKRLWDEATKSGTAYIPPKFEEDGGFTHGTAVPARLVSTANHFYTKMQQDERDACLACHRDY